VRRGWQLNSLRWHRIISDHLRMKNLLVTLMWLVPVVVSLIALTEARNSADLSSKANEIAEAANIQAIASNAIAQQSSEVANRIYLEVEPQALEKDSPSLKASLGRFGVDAPYGKYIDIQADSSGIEVFTEMMIKNLGPHAADDVVINWELYLVVRPSLDNLPALFEANRPIGTIAPGGESSYSLTTIIPNDSVPPPYYESFGAFLVKGFRSGKITFRIVAYAEYSGVDSVKRKSASTTWYIGYGGNELSRE